VLIINKFLHPNGGSETYIFKLGEYLSRCGHEVQYFGMEHEGRCVGNRVGAYTSEMDFRGGLPGKASYAVKTIYSREARVQIRKVLDDFKPDVCHLNNFNYQLTPSIILEIVKWRKRAGRECRIVFTAHDYQLVCPNHMMNNPITLKNCEKCLGGHFSHCFKDKCIHGSRAKSLIGMMEAVYWNWRGTYRYIDKIICCSEFLKTKMDTNPVFAGKTVTLHNFIEKAQGDVASEGAAGAGQREEVKDVEGGAERREKVKDVERGAERHDYVLYFGRFSQEKGVGTLIEAAKRLPEIQFVCAGSGEYAQQIEAVPNMKNVGFTSGEALNALIRGARFSVCPSEWYENCPFSVMESQERGTPVVGARIGGIPELVDDGVNGLLFESGNVDSLVSAVEKLWKDEALCGKFEEACLGLSRDDVGEYVEKLRKIIFE
jgi:glycosyltransferase involved in cell wall biosynthesis